MAIQDVIDFHSEAASLVEWARSNVSPDYDEFINDIIDGELLDVNGINQLLKPLERLNDIVIRGLDLDDDLQLDALSACEYIVNLSQSMAYNAELLNTAFESYDNELSEEANIEAAVELSANASNRLWNSIYGTLPLAAGGNNLMEVYDVLDEIVSILKTY